VLQVKPYPVQPNYAIVSSIGAHIAQPGQSQQPQTLTYFLDIVSTSPPHVIEDLIQKDVSAVHQKGELSTVDICLWNILLFDIMFSEFGSDEQMES